MATLRTTRTDIRSVGVREVNTPRTPQISADFSNVENKIPSQNFEKSKWITLFLLIVIILLFCILTWSWYPPTKVGFIFHLVLYFILGNGLCAILYETGLDKKIKQLFK